MTAPRFGTPETLFAPSGPGKITQLNLTAVAAPEPGSIALALVGGLGLMGLWYVAAKPKHTRHNQNPRIKQAGECKTLRPVCRQSNRAAL
jgi:hypothetical protein